MVPFGTPAFSPLRQSATFLFSLVLLIVLSAGLWRCSSFGDVRVVGQNFTDEIQTSQNLVFTFNKDLVPESRLNTWDSTQYITFEPAVKGKFKWTAANELVFSPVAGFGNATSYKAVLTGDLLKHSTEGRKMKVKSEQIGFHTPYLQIKTAERWWTVSKETGRPEARIRLFLNYPVNQQAAVAKLKLLVDGKETNFRSVASDDRASLLISADIKSSGDHNAMPIELVLQKGLGIEGGTYVSSEDVKLASSMPSSLDLALVEVKTGFENNKGIARIVLTQELTNESIANGFGIEPAVGTEFEKTENGFVVRGAFTETDTYVLRLRQSLKSVLGNPLKEEESQDLFFGKMPAAISFANKRAIYLTPKGSRNVGVQITNIAQVQVKITKVYENNIQSYIRNYSYENYAEIGNEWRADGSYNYSDDTESSYSDVIVNKVVETANLPKAGGVSALNLALPDQNDRRGVYLVTVNSKDEAWMGQTRLVSISDIGLIAREGKDEVWIFANSIKTTEALSDVEVRLVSTNNQEIATGHTDAKGVAHFSKLSEKAPGFKLGMITARSQDDFNYLLLSHTKVETSRYEVEGLRDNATGLQAFIYGERDVYRPGETIHYNTVVRTTDWKPAADIPVKVNLILPDGRILRTWRKNTNKQGAVEVEAAIDAAGITGTYILEVQNANEVQLASHAVSIEEFLPDRIQVVLSGAKQGYSAGETVALTAKATNLFGPPAAGRNYEMEAQLKKKVFTSKGFERFVFDQPSEVKFENIKRQGVTSSEGMATEKILIPSQYQDIGVLEGKVYVTVFDENGRPVNRLQRFEVYTQPVFYGIALNDRYVGTNAPVPVEIAGVNKDGLPVNGASAEVEVIRIEYQTVMEKVNGQLRYSSKRKEKPVYKNLIKMAGGKGRFSYVPAVSGEYEIRVRRPGAHYFSQSGFYAYSYGSTQYSSFEVSNEGRVLMETDKPSYRVGDKAKVLFKTPFDGKLIVTVERNSVSERFVLETAKKAAELTLKLTGNHIPNVYVSATLIRPLDDSQIPLTVAHGFAPLRVEVPERKMDVTVTAAASSRSKSTQKIRIKAQPNSQLTVAVVDEGIMQIKNAATPDIYNFFYQKKALEVGSYDLYALLFPELSFGAKSSSGGDGYNLERRINPLSNGRTQMVRFWSGILETNSNGEASFDVAIPQFSGDLRVMAVAYNGNSFGSATHHIKVADPIVISAGIPRFLSPGDQLSLPVNVANTEKKPTPAVVSLQADGPLSVEQGTVSVNLEAGKEGRAVFVVKALNTLGSGKLMVKVKAFGQEFLQETQISIRPPSPLLKVSSSGVIAGGQVANVTLASSFMPGTATGQLVFSRSPLVQSGGKALNALLGYPHGCLEQTISKAFPQIYLGDLAKAMAAPVYLVRNGESDFNPMTNVQQAVRKAESNQLYNGAFGLWPGALKEDWWLTAYTVHFLTEAERAGFEINGSVVSKALDYLISKTGEPGTEATPVYAEDGTNVQKIMAKREALYSLYVLAQAGRPNRPIMNYYKQNGSLLTTEGKYLLAAAFQQIGDGRSFADLLPAAYKAGMADNRSVDYASPLSNLGLVLNTLIEAAPQNPQITPLARQLSQALEHTSYLNTQEAAFAVLALGKIAKRVSNSTVTASITQNGKKLADFTGKDLRLQKGILNQKLQVGTTGKGDLYWFGQAEGMSSTGAYREEDNGIRIRRQYLDRSGKEVSRFKQNDLIVVKLSVVSTNGITIPNVVLTDILPAGFEVENPRLTEPREMPWIKKSAAPDYFDIRDDRIHYFTSASQSVQDFYYQVRVTARGTFTVGPAAADAMYQGEYHSYSGGKKVVVE